MDPNSTYWERWKNREHWTEEQWAEESRREEEEKKAWRLRWAVEKQRQKKVIELVAKELQSSFVGAEAQTIAEALEEILSKYGYKALLARSLGTASYSRKELLNLADKADALLDAAESLTEGTVEILSRDEVWKIGEPGEQEKEEFEPDDPLGPQWLVGLEKLVKIAREKVRILEEKTLRGGRKSLWTRLHGSPDDYLAFACRELAQSHGCKSQAVVIKMVQAVMEAEYGKAAMKKMDGKPSKDIGRKAVRKLVQTKPKTGTV